jgi:hypothetical protein
LPDGLNATRRENSYALAGVDRDWSWTHGILRPEQQRKAAGGDAELLLALALLSRLGVGRSGAAGRWWRMAVPVAAPICEEAVSGADKGE